MCSTTDEFVKQLSQLTMPLLLMSCAHDPLNQSDWDVNFQKIVPGSKVYRFKHSAHEPQIEETEEEFNRVLTEFLLARGVRNETPTVPPDQTDRSDLKFARQRVVCQQR